MSGCCAIDFVVFEAAPWKKDSQQREQSCELPQTRSYRKRVFTSVKASPVFLHPLKVELRFSWNSFHFRQNLSPIAWDIWNTSKCNCTNTKPNVQLAPFYNADSVKVGGKGRVPRVGCYSPSSHSHSQVEHILELFVNLGLPGGQLLILDDDKKVFKRLRLPASWRLLCLVYLVFSRCQASIAIVNYSTRWSL